MLGRLRFGLVFSYGSATLLCKAQLPLAPIGNFAFHSPSVWSTRPQNGCSRSPRLSTSLSKTSREGKIWPLNKPRPFSSRLEKSMYSGESQTVESFLTEVSDRGSS